MARVNVYLTDDLADKARAAGLNVSNVTQRALRQELGRRTTDDSVDRINRLSPASVTHGQALAALDAAREELGAGRRYLVKALEFAADMRSAERMDGSAEPSMPNVVAHQDVLAPVPQIGHDGRITANERLGKDTGSNLMRSHPVWFSIGLGISWGIVSGVVEGVLSGDWTVRSFVIWTAIGVLMFGPLMVFIMLRTSRP